MFFFQAKPCKKSLALHYQQLQKQKDATALHGVDKTLLQRRLEALLKELDTP